MSERKGVAIDFKYYPGAPEVGGGTTYEDESVTIEEKNFPSLSEYKAVTHRPTSISNIIDSIKYNEEIQTGFPPTLSQYPSVTVYCWGQDYRPLVVQLGNKNIYYVSEGEDYKSNQWNSTSTSFSGLSLLEILQIKSCTHTKAHVIDISKTIQKSYNCPSCNKEGINVLGPNKESGYIWYGHTLSGKDSSISGFKDGDKYQGGFKKFEGYDQANVYWYPDPAGKSLLVCIKPLSGPGEDESSEPLLWYKRHESSDRWVVENTKLSDNEEDPKILEILQKAFQTAQNSTSRGNPELSTSISSSATNPLVVLFIVGIVPVILIGIGYAGWSFLPRL